MKKTNVLLISMDTLRADHLSCYGCRRKTSPNIDFIGTEGAVFENAYSTAAWTPPAHASMLTGLFPSQHRVIGDNRLSNNVPTLAGVLRENGYQTAGFVNNSQVGALVGLDRGHEWFEEIWKGIDRSRVFARAFHKLKELSGYADKGAAETNRKVLSWLRSHADNVAPFYLFVHYIEAHNPLRPPRPFRSHYLTREAAGRIDMNRFQPVADNPLVCFTDQLSLTEHERESLEALYDEEIAYLDFRIGQLIDEIRGSGLLDNTLLIITADHGEHLGEHGLYSHAASLYEPITHIPLIVRYPRRFAAGKRERGIVQLTDIFPTVLDVTGARFDGAASLPGASLLRSKRAHERFSIAEWEGRVPHFVRQKGCASEAPFGEAFFRQPITMIRQGSYKYVRRPGGRDELYDVEKDAGERTDVLSNCPAVGESLRVTLERRLATMTPAVEEQRYEMDEDVRRNLEALGYM